MYLPHQKMTLPQKMWQGHFLVWQGHCKVWQCHFVWVLFKPSPEICHGKKNDLTHQRNVFTTHKNDLATEKVAKSFIGVARSFQSVAMPFFLSFVHTFARNLSWGKKWPNTPKKCICHTQKLPCHLYGGKVKICVARSLKRVTRSF